MLFYFPRNDYDVAVWRNWSNFLKITVARNRDVSFMVCLIERGWSILTVWGIASWWALNSRVAVRWGLTCKMSCGSSVVVCFLVSWDVTVWNGDTMSFVIISHILTFWFVIQFGWYSRVSGWTIFIISLKIRLNSFRSSGELINCRWICIVGFLCVVFYTLSCFFLSWSRSIPFARFV